MGHLKRVYVQPHTRTLPSGEEIQVKGHTRTMFVPDLGAWNPNQPANIRMQHLEEEQRKKYGYKENPRRAKLLVRQELIQLAELTPDKKKRRVAIEDTERLTREIEQINR